MREIIYMLAFLTVVVAIIVFPVVMLLRRADREHDAKRDQAQLWSMHMGFRPMATSCNFLEETTMLWGTEKCFVTNQNDRGEVFSVGLLCEVDGCSFVQTQQIR